MKPSNELVDCSLLGHGDEQAETDEDLVEGNQDLSFKCICLCNNYCVVSRLLGMLYPEFTVANFILGSMLFILKVKHGVIEIYCQNWWLAPF